MANWVQEFLYDDVRFLLIGAALFVGLLVFVLLTAGLRSRRRAPVQEAHRDQEDEPDENAPASLMATVGVEGTSETVAEVPVAPPPAIDEAIERGPVSHNDLVEEIATLEQGGDVLAAAKLCNQLADMAFDASDMDQAREYYLKGLSQAGVVDAPEVQAASRVRLGDISKAEGDLTTACEHWQLARELYAGCDETGKAADVEGKMSDNQCPTDWVLNEF